MQFLTVDKGSICYVFSGLLHSALIFYSMYKRKHTYVLFYICYNQFTYLYVIYIIHIHSHINRYYIVVINQ